MDILTHTVTGMAFAGCVALTGGKKIKEKAAIVLAGAFGGMLPDIDAISMWSRFDSTFGKWFGLADPGKVIYSAKYWYSHHGFMHSLFAAGLFTGILFLFLWGSPVVRKRQFTPVKPVYGWVSLAFWGGFVFHLLEDMITPASAWGGVRFFYPSSVYTGGTGQIWWWNNYDIFLIVCLVFFLTLLLLVLKPFFRKRVVVWGWILFLIGFIVITYQVKTRNFDFNRAAYGVSEDKSKEIQKQILPASVYHSMEKLDRWLILHF
ncbi:MAG: metal-dependent hydrolase [Tannerellaceae bacterium]|nr:metal-dependent hydrolase [Tannerellaceae bacterium]